MNNKRRNDMISAEVSEKHANDNAVCDVWDERYMTPDTVFDRLKTFFQVMELN